MTETSDPRKKRKEGRYRKVEVRIWGDEKFRALTPIPPCGQGLWFHLLTGPHTGPIPGLFRAGRAALAEELGWTQAAFDKAFREILDRGMAKADFSARLVWLPNGIKHNPPESPNVIKGWRAEFDLLPESPLKYEAFAFLQAFAEGMSEAFAKAFAETFKHVPRKPFGKVTVHPRPKTIGNQEQEQEQEEERPTREQNSQQNRDSTTPEHLGEIDDWDEGPVAGLR